MNDLSGANLIHTCHGIILQNIPCEPTANENKTDSQAENLLSLPRTEVRSMKSLTNDTLPLCYMNKRDSPKMMNDKLYRISSGAAVTFNIQSDIMNAELSGTTAKEAFISGRLQKNEQFFDSIKRLNQKTFADMGKASVVKFSTSSKQMFHFNC